VLKIGLQSARFRRVLPSNQVYWAEKQRCSTKNAFMIRPKMKREDVSGEGPNHSTWLPGRSIIK
jgi:hypothetical protein